MTAGQIQLRTNGADLAKLTEMQRQFVVNLLADEKFNVTGAARKAGYKEPQAAGGRLMRQKKVRAAIGKAMRLRIERVEFNQDSVLEQLCAALFLDPIELFEADENGRLVVRSLDDIPPEYRRCVTKLKVKRTKNSETVEVELMSKDRALELSMKHLGLLGTDGRGGGDNINVNIGTDVLSQLLQRAEQDRRIIDAADIQRRIGGNGEA